MVRRPPKRTSRTMQAEFVLPSPVALCDSAVLTGARHVPRPAITCLPKAVCLACFSTAICRQNNHENGKRKMAAPIKFGVGQSVLRKEDDALIRGKGRYTDDYAPQPAMHALVLRSPHAHANFTINASKARGLPGVGMILTGEDVRDLGSLPCLFNL